MTELLYLTDAYLREFTATVVDVEVVDVEVVDVEVVDVAVIDVAVVDVNEVRVALNRTAFYPTGGGQPHDTGTLAGVPVVNVQKEGPVVWHTLDGPAPSVGDEVTGVIDWNRRHALMRTHTALHILCGVIWNEWGVSVTGGNMEPLTARMDFEFDPLPEGFADRITELVNAEITADRTIEVSFLPRAEALADDDLIRTKVSLIPESVQEIRVVDIVGLDKQAAGGTHVASTSEVGTFTVTKTESKGKGNKRVRMELS